MYNTIITSNCGKFLIKIFIYLPHTIPLPFWANKYPKLVSRTIRHQIFCNSLIIQVLFYNSSKTVGTKIYFCVNFLNIDMIGYILVQYSTINTILVVDTLRLSTWVQALSIEEKKVTLFPPKLVFLVKVWYTMGYCLMGSDVMTSTVRYSCQYLTRY